MEISTEYAAGFFDGEGCVYLSISPEGWIAMRIEVAQVKPVVLHALAERWGGHVKHSVKRGIYTWGIYSKDVGLQFLQDVYPYLIVKKNEAWLAREALAQVTHFKGGGGKDTVTAEERALREGYSLALQEAKRKDRL